MSVRDLFLNHLTVGCALDPESRFTLLQSGDEVYCLIVLRLKLRRSKESLTAIRHSPPATEDGG